MAQKEWPELGDALKETRLGLGLTQDQVAKQLEIQTPTYNRYETGGTFPEADRELYRKLREFLKLSPTRFNELMIETGYRVKERRRRG